MKAINVLLSLLISVLLVVLVLEGGLRVLGMGPPETIHRFDDTLGWAKRAGAVGHKKTREFDVSFEVNQLGLRDDPMPGPEKEDGTFRALALGDSFVLGYTVDRKDLFVDQLETLWSSSGGTEVDVVNAGTEGWSTDQEALWFLEHGERFAPDLVLLFPYENDLYWNGQTAYTRFPKPRFEPDGTPEARTLADPGERGFMANTAVGRLLGAFGASSADPAPWSPDGEHVFAGPRKEYAAYFHDAPDFMQEAVARTRGALQALKQECDRIGSRLVVVPIPNKAVVDSAAREALEGQIGVPADQWTATKPVETFHALARELGIDTLDVRADLAAATEADGPQYYAYDWHFNPAGNRTFALFLDRELSARGLVPNSGAAPEGADRASLLATEEAPATGAGIPTWVKLYALLTLVFGTLFGLTYADEKQPMALFKVGAFLGLIFGIVIGGNQLLSMLPPSVSQILLIVFLLGIIGFVLYKLGRRTGTIVELLSAFVLRGHWYLMPLVVILLTVGSLLVVAASSPLVAPFIYTLF